MNGVWRKREEAERRVRLKREEQLRKEEAKKQLMLKKRDDMDRYKNEQLAAIK